MKIQKLAIVLGLYSLHIVIPAHAQENSQKDDYRQVVRKRAEKIVATLGVTDSLQFLRTTHTIATQYENLNDIHSVLDVRKKNAKEKATTDKAAYDQEIKTIENETMKQLDSLHHTYINNLARELNKDQIEKVKDGMTYGVLPITYKGYQEMLPDLTTEQKANILTMLTEAREKAMDAGSSEEKHKWFGKYKGRINNYLSAQGYNMKKASEDWQARIKAGKSK